MKSFRFNKSEKKYQKYIEKERETAQCPLCIRVAIKEFKYWKIIKNHFPYDRIAKKHQMIIPFRHVTEGLLKKEEIDELVEIKNSFIKNSDYNYIMEATPRTKSVPAHFHLHLITLK